jgi:hypothetical protein
MTDIDFEEIDRAVASAKEQQGIIPPSADASTEQPSQPATTPSAHQVVQRSRGRVMDIIHPSAARSSANRLSINPAPRLGVESAEQANNPASNSAPESPFIPDAKIEKRPLGGFSKPEGSDDKPQTEASVVTEEATTQAEVEPEVESVNSSSEMLNAPLPEELHPDLINLDSLGAEPVASEQESAPQPTAEPLSVTARVDTNKSAEPVSIYDTDTYHKPLAHPQKKSSGVLTTLWIVLFIAIGVGVGAAVYFFVLPNL